MTCRRQSHSSHADSVDVSCERVRVERHKPTCCKTGLSCWLARICRRLCLQSQDLADETWLSCPARGGRPVLLLFQRRTPANLDDPEGDQGPPQHSSGMLNCVQSHVSTALQNAESKRTR